MIQPVEIPEIENEPCHRTIRATLIGVVDTVLYVLMAMQLEKMLIFPDKETVID